MDRGGTLVLQQGAGQLSSACQSAKADDDGAADHRDQQHGDLAPHRAPLLLFFIHVLWLSGRIEQVEDFGIFWKAVFGELGEQQSLAAGDLEAAAAAAADLHVHAIGLPELVSRTERPGLVVSGPAVFDPDGIAHRCPCLGFEASI